MGGHDPSTAIQVLHAAILFGDKPGFAAWHLGHRTFLSHFWLREQTLPSWPEPPKRERWAGSFSPAALFLRPGCSSLYELCIFSLAWQNHESSKTHYSWKDTIELLVPYTLITGVGLLEDSLPCCESWASEQCTASVSDFSGAVTGPWSVMYYRR